METEKSAWLMFKVVFVNFLGNVQAENYEELVEDLLNVYQTIRCNMSLTIHFFFCILTWASSLSTWAQCAVNMGKGSARIFPPWRKDMQESCH